MDSYLLSFSSSPLNIENPDCGGVSFQGGKALEVEVEEEAAVGTVAGYVSATDSDSGDNALIDYRITGKYSLGCTFQGSLMNYM